MGNGVMFTGVWHLQVSDVSRCVMFTGVWHLQVCDVHRCVMFTGVWCLQVCDVYRCVMFTGVWCLQVCDVYRCVRRGMTSVLQTPRTDTWSVIWLVGHVVSGSGDAVRLLRVSTATSRRDTSTTTSPSVHRSVSPSRNKIREWRSSVCVLRWGCLTSCCCRAGGLSERRVRNVSLRDGGWAGPVLPPLHLPLPPRWVSTHRK